MFADGVHQSPGYVLEHLRRVDGLREQREVVSSVKGVEEIGAGGMAGKEQYLASGNGVNHGESELNAVHVGIATSLMRSSGGASVPSSSAVGPS